MNFTRGEKENFMKTGKSIFYGIFCTILGIGIFIYGIYNLVHYAGFYFTGKTFDLNHAISNGEELPLDTYVTLTSNSVLGNYAETKHTYGFIPIGKDEHYIVLLDDNTFMSVTVKGKTKIDQLEKIADETWADENYYATSYITLVGRIQNFTGGEIYGYYKDAFSQMGFDLTAADTPIRNLTLEATETRGNQWLWEIGYFLIGALSFFAGLAYLGVLNKGNASASITTTVTDPNMSAFDTPSYSDPFVADSTGSSSASGPFATDSTMDSFKSGYDDMMSDITGDSDDNSTGSGSGLKLKS